MTLTWENIHIKARMVEKRCCSRKTQISDKNTKNILNNVSGIVEPGQFLSIIGASGAGKTTLLNYLSGKLASRNLVITGEVKINGISKDKIEDYGVFSAFVQQDDVLYQTMTVRECIDFSAKLRFIGTQEERQKKIDKIISDLKLTKCQDTFIGGPLLKGVSGGERKRTSIGVELITNPSLIFLDEPTTGLDSYTATQLMQILKNLADSGRTIIQTIHQPNSEIFENFDRLMLLAQGKIMYFNNAELARNYFSKIGYPCPNLTNPADFYMSIMSKESLQVELEFENMASEDFNNEVNKRYNARIEHFVKEYENSELRNSPIEYLSNTKFDSIDSKHANNRVSWCTEFCMLAKRNLINIVRLPFIIKGKIVSTVMLCIFELILYTNVDETKTGVQNRNGALFFVSMSFGFQGFNNISLVFPSERPVFLREV